MTINDLLEFKSLKELIFIDFTNHVNDAAILMEKFNIGFLFVRAEEDIIGIVSERDIVCRSTKADNIPSIQLITEIMTKEIKWGSTKDDILKSLKILKEGDFRHLPIKDDSGNPIGIISERDITSFLLGKLEKNKLS